MIPFSQGRNSQYLMVQLFYEAMIIDEPSKVSKTLSRLKSKFSCVSFDYLYNKQDDNDVDQLVLLAGGEPKNYHKITMVSGDTKRLLKYDKNQLEGKDLSIIMPEPLKIRHSQSFGRINNTGRLSSNKYINEFCEKNDGDLVSVRIFIKISYF